MTSAISNRPLALPSPRGPIDASGFEINAANKQRVARGQTTERQARIDSETSRIFRDESLSTLEKAKRMLRVEGSNGDGTSGIRFQSAAEAAEFAQDTQQRLKDSYDLIKDGEQLLSQVENRRANFGDRYADQIKLMAENSISAGQGGVRTYTLALQEHFSVAGEITKISADGAHYEPGSFSLSFKGERFAVRLSTPDWPSQGAAKDDITLVQVLDGVVRQRTDRTKPGLNVDRRA